MLPSRRPAGSPRRHHVAQDRKEAGVRERRHRPAGGRHQRDLFRLARRNHGGAERADVLGAVLRGRRRAAPRRLNPTPGTLNCADFPASVSTAPVQCMEISLYPAYNVLSKMIYPDPALRRDIMCIGGTSQWPATIFRGIDQWGERYGYLLVDPIGG